MSLSKKAIDSIFLQVFIWQTCSYEDNVNDAKKDEKKKNQS